LGEIQKDRVRALGSENWMRLPILLRVDRNSREYNEANRGNIFYAESCLLAHMLMLGENYKDKFARFLDRVSATGSSQTSLTEVYGKSLAEIEKDLNGYFRQTVQQGGAIYRVALPKFEIGEARPATGAEVSISLATLTAHLGRTEEARKRFKELEAKYSANAEIEASLGYLEALNGEKDAALAHYRLALSHNPAGWRICWNYARLLDDMGGELQPRLQALENTLQRKADLTEAQLRLGRDLIGAGRFPEALARLQKLKNVEGEYAAAVWFEMAHAAFELKQGAEARRYLEEAGRAARTTEERTAVERMLAGIEKSSPGATGTEVRPPAEPDADRPTLRRTAPTTVKKKN
jgi:tetratricopeptide (TPR) repeat protein